MQQIIRNGLAVLAAVMLTATAYAEKAATTAPVIGAFRFELMNDGKRAVAISTNGVERELMTGHQLRFGSRGVMKAQLDYTAPGKDVNGDGVPDLVITDAPPHPGCCLLVKIFSVRDTVTELASINAGFAKDTEFLPVANRTALDYLVKDFTFGGWGSSDFSNPAPEVRLRFVGDKLIVATAVMQRDTLSAETARVSGAGHRAALMAIEPTHSKEDLPASLTAAALQLVYTGNGAVLSSFLSGAWPEGRPGQKQYLNDIREQLQKSPYREGLAPFFNAIR